MELDESLDLESQTFNLTLTGESIKIIMSSLHFSHGFFGGVDTEIQDQTVAVNNEIVSQVTEQIPHLAFGDVYEEEEPESDDE